MKQLKNMESLLDFVYQAMFTVTKKGYSPKEVDAFIEELKEECRMWDEKYQKLEEQFRQLQETVQKEGTVYGSDAGKKTGD